MESNGMFRKAQVFWSELGSLESIGFQVSGMTCNRPSNCLMTHTLALPIETIFHPSDFSASSEVAFAHALKMALSCRAKLRILHVKTDDQTSWQDFPGVRETLARWGTISPDAASHDLSHLGLEVRKVVSGGENPVSTCIQYLEKHPADLIVLAVHHHEGLAGWFHRPVGEPIAQKSGLMTLFLPHGVEGFISRQTGAVNLNRILIPVTHKPRPQASIDAAVQWIQYLQIPAGTVTLLHVGEAADAPSIRIPTGTGWNWETVILPGDPADQILEVSRKKKADLIIMTTDGPNGFLDALRGSTSHRVLQRSHCPILNLPVGVL